MSFQCRTAVASSSNVLVVPGTYHIVLLHSYILLASCMKFYSLE